MMIEQNEPARIIWIPTGSNHNIIWKGDNLMADSQVTKSKKVCQVEGCDKKHLAKGYCQKHYDQIRMHGYIRQRTVFEPNNFIIENDICTIELFDGKGKKSGEAIIDAKDFNIVKDKKWGLSKKGYVVSSGGDIKLHRFLMSPEKKQQVDHRNHIKTDNKRLNLRICNNSQNQQNAQFRKTNTSGAKNVHWFKANQKWQVQFRKNGKSIYSGYFESFDEANHAACETRQKLHREFACDG